MMKVGAINNGVVIDHILTPIIGGKIEGGAPDKVMFYRCQDDMLRGFDKIEAMDEKHVAPESLAREFIGGSTYNNH